MPYDEDTLNKIYDRTEGRCHICGKRLSFVNYARPRRRGAWEVEHSLPRAKGGTDHLNNLFPSCMSCNREKKAVTTRTARDWHGRKRAPFSREKKKKVRMFNAFAGGTISGFIGSFAGPWGIALGAAIGAKLGYDADPDKG